MTDQSYADLRAALDAKGQPWKSWIAAANPDTIRALLADYDEASARAFYETTVAEAAIEQVKKLEAERDRLREALLVATEHNALHFGESHNTVIQGRAALAQEQGGSDAQGH